MREGAYSRWLLAVGDAGLVRKANVTPNTTATIWTLYSALIRPKSTIALFT